MSLQNATAADSGIEECIDKMNDFVATLSYPPKSIAAAQSVHLHTMLCALVHCELSTREEIKAFVEAFAQDVLEEIGAEASDELHPGSQPVSLNTSATEKVPDDDDHEIH